MNCTVLLLEEAPTDETFDRLLIEPLSRNAPRFK